MPQIKCTYYNDIHCKQQWQHLTIIDREKHIKHCQECARQVHWCNTAEDVKQALNAGQCIASHNETLREAGVLNVPNCSDELFVGGKSDNLYLIGIK